MASRIEAIAVELAHCRSPKVLKSKLLSLKKAVKDIEETEDREKYIAAAKQKYLGDNEVEIDSDAVVSKGEDHGAFVSAWVWVEDTWTKEGRTMVRITFTSFCKDVGATQQQIQKLIRDCWDHVDFCSAVSKKFGRELTLKEAAGIYETAPSQD